MSDKKWKEYAWALIGVQFTTRESNFENPEQERLRLVICFDLEHLRYEYPFDDDLVIARADTRNPKSSVYD
jgi:hypothetical protein